MKYRQTGEYNEIAERAELVPFSSFPALKIGKLTRATGGIRCRGNGHGVTSTALPYGKDQRRPL